MPEEARRGPAAGRDVFDINLRSGPQMREYEAIAERLAAAGLSPVLDWGSGHGALSQLLHERGVAVESYEYFPELPPGPTQNGLFPELTVHVGNDPVKLPFADGQFGAVVSCGVLEHVQEPEASLRELHRVLRPGGRLFVYKLPNRFSYLEAVAKRAGMYYHGKHEHDRVYDLRRASAILAGNGFRVDEVRRANMLPLTITHPLGWRFAGAIWRLNTLLARIPGLNLLATNVDADATALPQGGARPAEHLSAGVAP